MKNKYIELLLKRCLMLENNSSLFINYNKINKDFVDDLVEYANNLGVKDIYLDEVDSYEIHNIIKNSSEEEIKNCKLFNSSKWDEYAKKNAAFLMLETLIPNLMDDVDNTKLELSAKLKRESKPIYKEKQLNSEIPWCIACLPNKYWAEDLFKESSTPLEDFWNVLGKILMLDKKEPIKEWDNFLQMQEEKIKKLNNMKIESLHYTNDLGTDLNIYLTPKTIWASGSSDKWIVNIPTYEIFTTPDYRKTEGKVYSSKPLVYNGTLIEDFYLEFKEGKVVDFDAKKGKDILKEIINGDEFSSFLGECALVDFNSPISNTNIIFKTTLLDENASCHLALGNGFLECLIDGENLSKEELEALGLNTSKNHVDFMIGTKDLKIEAKTKNGMEVIMENGNLVI